MAGQIFFAALAAWGLLCALWAAFGWLLPGSSAATVVLLYPGSHPEGIIDRFRWLSGLGLLKCRLLIAGADPDTQAWLSRKYHDIEFCSPEELSAGPEAEREAID